MIQCFSSSMLARRELGLFKCDGLARGNLTVGMALGTLGTFNGNSLAVHGFQL